MDQENISGQNEGSELGEHCILSHLFHRDKWEKVSFIGKLSFFIILNTVGSSVGSRGYLAGLCVLGHHGRPVLREGDVGLYTGVPPLDSDL